MRKIILVAMLFFLGAVPVEAKVKWAVTEDLEMIEATADRHDFTWSMDDTGMLLINLDVGNILSDKDGIGFFSYDIFDIFTSKDKLPYLPYGVAFRGFATHGDNKDRAVAVYYFSEETANRDWSELHIDMRETYKFADYTGVVSPFSQYLDNYITQDVDEDDPIDNALMRMTYIPRP